MNTKEIREELYKAGLHYEHGEVYAIAEEALNEVDRLREALKECREAVGYTGSYDEVHAIVKAALNPKEKK